MKVGEKIPVTIAGQVVAQGSVKEVGDGTVSIVVPATLVVMATRTELAEYTPQSEGTPVVLLDDGIARPEVEAPLPVPADPPEETPMEAVPAEVNPPAEFEAPAVESGGTDE